MTIVKKWRLMLSSFADIRAAVLEKGGVLSDGKGYNRYANAVRSIYSDTYTDEYEYPQKVSPAVSNALSLVRWCALIKEQIRQAIIAGGVECDTSVPLSAYGDKIRALNTELRIVTKVFPSAKLNKEYTAEVTAEGGTPPYKFRLSNPDSVPHYLVLNENGRWSGKAVRGGGKNYMKVEVIAEDAEGKTVSKNFSLYVSN